MIVTREDVYYARTNPQALADKLNGMAKVKVVAGAASGNVALGDTPAAVIAVLAITTATGAAAAKLLLAPTTDYTVSGSNLVMVTDQAANTLVVIYK